MNQPQEQPLAAAADNAGAPPPDDLGAAFGRALARLDLTEREDEQLMHTYGCLEDFRGAAIELAAAMKFLHQNGYSPREVADHCDLPYSTVRNWMRSGRVHRVPAGTYLDD